MCATFNGNRFTKIIFWYVVTNASNETDMITFNKEINSFVLPIPKQNIPIIGGVRNPQIGKET